MRFSSQGSETPNMGNELAYTILTPHTVRKGRLGAVLSQLLSRVELDLISGGLFQVSSELAQAFADTIEDPLVAAYVRRELPFLPQTADTSLIARHDPRALLLVFNGPNAVEQLANVVGSGLPETRARGTIRGVFGDHIRADSDQSTLYLNRRPWHPFPATLPSASCNCGSTPRSATSCDPSPRFRKGNSAPSCCSSRTTSASPVPAPGLSWACSPAPDCSSKASRSIT